VRDEVKEGDQILVKVVNIDPSGKIRLSRKALIEDAEGVAPGEGGGGGSGEHRRPEPRGEHRDHGRREPGRDRARHR
jgi:polyribonucleotide nucleotidyltransferase